jgi:diguanylate cyclase (GGDEF)-like protein
MNYSFLPDLFALAMLVVILLLVRRRHSEERSNAWLLGVFITLAEGVAHTFYPHNAVPPKLLHVVVVDCYMLAGIVFVWAASDQSVSRASRLLFLTLEGIPLVALTTAYGLNLRYGRAYAPAIVGGIVVGIATSLAIRKSWRYALLHVIGWSMVAVVISNGMYRQATYWVLGYVYFVAAINFHKQLQRGSTGRLAIVTGFSIWAFFFFAHPWVVDHAAIVDIASHMWNLQKSLISIGMILVLLEKQATSNAYLAHHDELTGLPNRRMFAARLSVAMDQAARQKGSLALVMLDLDGFKVVNDTLGHLAGDQLLREVASTLRSNVRASDVVARMGGDEFIILADGVTGEGSARRFCDSIRSALEHPINFQGQLVRVSASVGVALYPEDARDPIKLLRIADQRMYHRKKAPMSVRPIEASMAALPRA